MTDIQDTGMLEKFDDLMVVAAASRFGSSQIGRRYRIDTCLQCQGSDVEALRRQSLQGGAIDPEGCGTSASHSRN